MRQAEITVTLPPATQDTVGDIVARTYPITIQPTGGTQTVRVEEVAIVPASGVAEVWVSGGGLERRQIVERQTIIPQAVGDSFRPLGVTLINLNPDAAVQLVVTLSVFDAFSGMGGGARFTGPHPFGTDGAREDDYSDTAGTRIIKADGSGFVAWMTTNAPTVTRTIREITGQTRILSPTGTGSIPTSGGGNSRMFIVKKDGVVLESSADTLDVNSGIFSVSIPTAGTLKLLGLTANSITSTMLKPGAIDTAAVAAQAITPDKLSETYALASHTHVPPQIIRVPILPTILNATSNTRNETTINFVAGHKYECRARVDLRGYGLDGTSCEGRLIATFSGSADTRNVQFDGGVDSSPFALAFYTTAGGGTTTASWSWSHDGGRAQITYGIMEIICLPIT